MSIDETFSAVCFYCQMPLTVGYEMDHAPIPKRAGGTETVPACHNCHNLKDRIPAKNWPAELMFEAFEGCSPLGRILLAKAFAIKTDRDFVETEAAA